MKLLFVAVFLAALSTSTVRAGGTGGGTECAACTLVVNLVEQLAQVHSQSVDAVVEDLCSYLPKDFTDFCDSVVQKYGKSVIELLEKKESADTVCHQLGMCTDPQCFLRAPPKTAPLLSERPEGSASSLVPKWIMNLINRMAEDHEPVEDLDHDLYSSLMTLRGGNWRGRDCDDFVSGIYPSRQRTANEDPYVDWNCNGIKGRDSDGTPLEDKYCKDTKQMGTVILGDSAAAHFHVPPAYLNASAITKETYNGLLDLLEMEFDWPQCSSTTGFESDKKCPGPVSSLYLRMREHNRCNHRDYENIAVNGARVGSMNSSIIRSLARTKSSSPAVVLHALIGNDVCSPHKTFDHMTKPEDMRASVMASLQYLDENLAEGSHVFLVGLVDGRVLFDTMHNRIHPVNVTYTKVYDFLNCLSISPCWGWMNSNDTVREGTYQHAAALNNVYKEIVATESFSSFTMSYFDYPIRELFDQWKAQGRDPAELIEPVDGFHPSQRSNMLIGEYVWNLVRTNFSSVIGPENPNNDAIAQQFGDQGGY